MSIQTGKFRFMCSGEFHYFSAEQIIRLEAVSNYTYVYFLGHHRILMAKALGDYEILLRPYGFIRTHRSHLVNTKHILQATTKGAIIMIDESRAEISRRKKKETFYAIKSSADLVAC